MNEKRVIRRVTKRVYDQYAFVDYAVSTDNLNPLNPTKLESQVTDMTHAIHQKILNAYDKAQVQIPEELFDPDTSPATMLGAIDELLRKTKDNPLRNLMNDLGGSGTPSGALTSVVRSSTDDTFNKLSFLDNPPKLDCEGVLDTTNSTGQIIGEQPQKDKKDSNKDSEEDSNSNNSEDESSTESSNGNITGSVKITYRGIDSNENTQLWPKSFRKSNSPFSIAICVPTVVPNGLEFRGWYLDSSFSKPVKKNKLQWTGHDVTVFAYFDIKDDTGLDSQTTDDPNIPIQPDMNDCDLIELSFLKIILVIIIILKILIKVFVLVFNIMKAMADIMKDAQLCWINPPSLQSLISYVMQRLSAIIFQIVGMILLKIWAMLNLDCIGSNTMNTISQINAALSGLMDAFGEIESLALQFGTQSNGLAESVKEMIKNLKSDLQDQKQKLVDAYNITWEDIKNQAKDWAGDMEDAFTNPRTYLDLLPPEQQNKILGVMSQIDSTKETMKRVQTTVERVFGLNSSTKVNDVPKNVDVTVVS